MVHGILERRKSKSRTPNSVYDRSASRAEPAFSHILEMAAHFPSLFFRLLVKSSVFLSILSINPFLCVLGSVTASCKQDPELIQILKYLYFQMYFFFLSARPTAQKHILPGN
uniref:Uncharacterized protein n=1 Tax=Prolemur simus TaxID=1328070 RepID=A0A8C9ANA3_PROSS